MDLPREHRLMRLDFGTFRMGKKRVQDRRAIHEIAMAYVSTRGFTRVRGEGPSGRRWVQPRTRLSRVGVFRKSKTWR